MKVLVYVLLILSVLAVNIVFSTCGDGICGGSYPPENCKTCPADCLCPKGSSCDPNPTYNSASESVFFENQSMGCVHIAQCGDGFCDYDTPAKYHKDHIVENCANCPSDCGCTANWSNYGYYQAYGASQDTFRQPYGPYDYCDVDTSSDTYGACIKVSYCGDNTCDWENRSRNFMSDCADCPETCTSCPNDCDCEALVGKGFICAPTLENADQAGCAKPSVCGDNYCDMKKDENGKNIGETCKTCPADCGCGNLSCEETDLYDYACISTTSTEWTVCDPATNTFCHQHCGDGTCSPFEYENCNTCQLDCACDPGQRCAPQAVGDAKGCASGQPVCGDGTCEGSENCTNCPDDCFCQGTPPEHELFCSDGVDEDMDGKTDCADDDCAYNPKCVGEENKKNAKSLKDRYLADLKNRSMDTTGLDTIESLYSDRPMMMADEMKKYMDKNVYGLARLDYYLGVIGNDPAKQQALRDIAANNNDPFAREIALQEYTYQNCEQCKNEASGLSYIGDKVMNPPKWLYGGEYGVGGALDWSNFIANKLVAYGRATGKEVPIGIESYATGTTIYIAVLDSKDLLEKGQILSQTNIEDSSKVGLIVLDGSMKIAKLVDPTGYFSTLGDATVGKVILVTKMISDRNQGYFNWNGRILHQDASGVYTDINTNEKFTRVAGGWFSSATFIPTG